MAGVSASRFYRLLLAAKVALEFMERVESTEWENGGAETIPEVEEFRAAVMDAMKSQ